MNYQKPNNQTEKHLAVKVITEPGDIERFNMLLEQEHKLGNRAPSGDTLRQVVTSDGEWVALFLWGSAALRLKPRDEMIGWDAAKRSSRLKLVVQNSRFLMINAKRQQHVASQILATATRELPAQWLERYGYQPVLAETFTDPEVHQGTCYKANGWIEAGDTAGFSRDSVDFYVRNDRPKRLWIKGLVKNWKEVLRAVNLPEPYRAAQTQPPSRELALSAGHLESLIDVLCRVPDPRRNNRSHLIGSLLATVLLGLLCGKTNLLQIYKFARQLKPDQKKQMLFPRKKKTPNIFRTPSYKTFWTLMNMLDYEQFAEQLNVWFQSQMGTLPPALAMDGKMIRDLIGTLNIVDARTGRPVATVPIQDKQSEIIVGRQAIGAISNNGLGLDGAIVTADAAHCQKDTARAIVENNGEYLLQVKKNQLNLYKKACEMKKHTPFLQSRKKGTAELKSEVSPSSH